MTADNTKRPLSIHDLNAQLAAMLSPRIQGLQAKGYRFVWWVYSYKWIHRLEVPLGAVDCTDMTDQEFSRFYEGHQQK